MGLSLFFYALNRHKRGMVYFAPQTIKEYFTTILLGLTAGLTLASVWGPLDQFGPNEILYENYSTTFLSSFSIIRIRIQVKKVKAFMCTVFFPNRNLFGLVSKITGCAAL